MTNDRRVVLTWAIVRCYDEALAYAMRDGILDIRRLIAFEDAVQGLYMAHFPKKVASRWAAVMRGQTTDGEFISSESVSGLDMDQVTSAKMGLVIGAQNIGFLYLDHVEEAAGAGQKDLHTGAVCAGIIRLRAKAQEELDRAAAAAAVALDVAYSGRRVSVAGSEACAPILVIEEPGESRLVPLDAIEAELRALEDATASSEIVDATQAVLDRFLNEGEGG
ncbi:hypothetical protein [Sinimarinibacterium sp. CAU 1509]|uniref:hypothetical protein n=1 Tax=Sinimarinibacterium sp. CAU 1509 TaxID=2562283 RepID=UPI001B7F8107|nr:hypothetical protein [Sinimarinibacterium sp. CAU 1509]